MSSASLGDMDVSGKALLVKAGRGDGFKLGVGASVSLPMGSREAFTSDGSVGFRPRLIAGWEGSRLSMAANAGWNMRRAVPGIEALAADDVPISTMTRTSPTRATNARTSPRW